MPSASRAISGVFGIEADFELYSIKAEEVLANPAHTFICDDSKLIILGKLL